MSNEPITHADPGPVLEDTEYLADGAHTTIGVKIGDAPTELTLDSGGVVAATQSWHTLDTYGDAASDNFVQATGLQKGWLYFFQAEHTDRTVVVTNSAYIRMEAGQPFSLSNTNRLWIGLAISSTVLVEVTRKANA